MYKSEQRYINEKLLPAHAHTRHFFGYSQEIITKIYSLHARLIFRRRLIRVCRGISVKDLKNELLHPTPLKMKIDCGRSRVRSSGPATFFRED